MWSYSSKKVNEKLVVSIVMDQWISFISQYEWSKVEVSKPKASTHSNRDKVNIFLYQSNYTIQSSYSSSNNNDASTKSLFPELSINRNLGNNILI